MCVDRDVRGRLANDELRTLRTRLNRMLRAAGATEQSAVELQASLRLVSDVAMHALNRDYRGIDRPTDVLAFAQREGEGGHLQPQLLGDIVISLDTAERQASGKGLLVEVLFLAVHGLCHLLGYDHQTDEEEATMNERMAALQGESERRGQTRAA